MVDKDWHDLTEGMREKIKQKINFKPDMTVENIERVIELIAKYPTLKKVIEVLEEGRDFESKIYDK